MKHEYAHCPDCGCDLDHEWWLEHGPREEVRAWYEAQRVNYQRWKEKIKTHPFGDIQLRTSAEAEKRLLERAHPIDVLERLICDQRTGNSNQ